VSSSSAAASSLAQSSERGRSVVEHRTTGKTSKHVEELQHSRAETLVYSDTDWKPGSESDNYATSSGR